MTGEGKLYLGTVLDLCSRRLLALATSTSPNAELACDAIKMAVAVRGGADQIQGVIFHTDRGSTYTAGSFTSLCTGLKIRQSMGRVGSCFDNAVAEAWFSTLEWELLRHRTFTTREEAAREISRWTYEFYNGRRRHSTIGMSSPVRYEESLTLQAIAA